MFWWSGNAMSLLGSNVSNMAFPLLAIFTTGSVLNAGIIAAAGRIGGLLTLLWGGALADRRSRKVILVVAPALQAVLMGVVTVSLLKGPVHVNLLAGTALLSGLIDGVRSGAVLPALRRIVPREQFAARAAQEQGQAMAAQLVGSPLAALLFSIARWMPFGVDAVSFFFASLGALFIRHPLGPDREPPATGGPDASKPKRPSVISDIRDGFRVILRHDFLRYTTGWVAVTNLVGNSFLLLVIALLHSRGASPKIIGVTNAGALAGGILGALLAAAILRRMRALRIFQIGGWVYVVSLSLAAILPAPWQIGLATAAFTFASVPTVTVWESYTARLVPDQLTGRVGAASAFCAQSLTWLGLLLAGWLASVWGAPVATLWLRRDSRAVRDRRARGQVAEDPAGPAGTGGRTAGRGHARMRSTSELWSPLDFTCSEGSTGIGPTATPSAIRLCAVVFVDRPPSQLPNGYR